MEACKKCFFVIICVTGKQEILTKCELDNFVSKKDFTVRNMKRIYDFFRSK